MAIEFSCPHCQQMVRTPPTAAGKKGRCPSCAAVVHIPALGSSERLPALAAANAPSSRTPAPGVPGIEFFCVECGQLVRTPAAAAGKKGKCPNCKALITIPHKAAGSKSSPSLPARFTPSPRTPTADLTPLEELEPLPVAPPKYAPPPVDLEPLLDEVLPPLAPAPAGTLPEGAWNPPAPASTPFATGHQAVWRQRMIQDLNRRGLPWERDPSLETYFDTVRHVLSAPGDAFLTMTRQGMGSPMGFFLVSAVAGNLIALVMWTLGMIIIGTFSVVFMHHGEAVVIPWEGLLVLFGGLACLMIFMGLVTGTVGNVLNAVLFHLSLMICGAANGGFTTTYRVVSFGLGSVYILASIPVLNLAAIVMWPIVLTYGFMNAHETSGGKAFLAAILPTLFGLGIFAALLLLNLPWIMEAIKAATPAAAHG